jgi:MOSC domain-containing protein YiiM
MQICHIFISPAHNFKGHFGGPPGTHPVQDVEEAECVAGAGLVGDRYFNYKSNFKGQITFVSREVFEAACKAVGAVDCPPWAMRRNVMTEGLDLNTLIGRRFDIQGVRFQGSEECAPCSWMNEALGPGAEKFLRGRGGLRARILSGGTLRRGAGEFKLVEA